MHESHFSPPLARSLPPCAFSSFHNSNPAVALGLSIANGLDNFGYCLGAAIADLIGGVLAAGIFYLVAPDQFDTSGEYENVGAA